MPFHAFSTPRGRRGIHLEVRHAIPQTYRQTRRAGAHAFNVEWDGRMRVQ